MNNFFLLIVKLLYNIFIFCQKKSDFFIKKENGSLKSNSPNTR